MDGQLDASCRGRQNLDAAYDFINFILDPENSAKELEFHGYNTGDKGIEELLADDCSIQDMIFFTPEQVETMQRGRGQRGAGPPRRDLQQGQGGGRRADRRPAATTPAVEPSATAAQATLARCRSSRSRCRRGSGTSASSSSRCVFVVVVQLRTQDPGTVGGGRSTLIGSHARQLPRGARATRSSQVLSRRCERRIIGTVAVPADRLPGGLLHRGEGARHVAGC